MVYFIIAFLTWISFCPEPVQVRYAIYIKVFLASLFFLVLIRKKDIKSLFNRRDIPLFLFLICITGGVFSAQDRGIALKTYLDISLILFFLYYLTKEIFSSDRNSRILAQGICILAAMVALFGLFEFLSSKNFIYKYLIDNPYYERFLGRRPMATQFNPSVLASFLLACLPFNLFLIRDKASFLRLLGIVSLILGIAVIILTFSRSAFLGLIGLTLFYLWNKKKKMLCILSSFIFILFIIMCSQPNVNRNIGHFGIKGMVYAEGYRAFLSEFRKLRLKMAFDMLKDHTLFGVGLNHFRIKFNDYKLEKDKDTPYEFMIADNMYLTLLAETGIIGFSGFLVFIFYLFKRGLNSFHKLGDRKEREVLLIALSALLGILINMAGYELFYWHNPFALFCILCGIVAARSHLNRVHLIK